MTKMAELNAHLVYPPKAEHLADKPKLPILITLS